MTQQEDGGWVLEPKQDEAGLGEYLIGTPPEWGTRYADDGTQAELERLQRENTALREIISKQQMVFVKIAEYFKGLSKLLGDWGPNE